MNLIRLGFVCWALLGISIFHVSAAATDLQVKVEIAVPSPGDSAILSIYLLNTSKHDLTVLTDGLSYSHNWLGAKDNHADPWLCDIGYTDKLEKDGHLLIPSLNTLGPVTIHPDEATMAIYTLDDEDSLAAIKKKTPIIVTYQISAEWGQRLSTWSGSVKAPPAVAKQFQVKTLSH